MSTPDHDSSLAKANLERLVDTRRFFLAGYLSALPEFRTRHPESLLPLASQIIAVLQELEP